MSDVVLYGGGIGLTPHLSDADAMVFDAVRGFRDCRETDESKAIVQAMQDSSGILVKWYTGLLHLSPRRGSLIPDKGNSHQGVSLWLKLLIDHLFAPRGYVLDGTISWTVPYDGENRGTIYVDSNRIEAVNDATLNPGPTWNPAAFACAQIKSSIELLIDSADNTGCTDDLTVVCASAVEALRSQLSKL